MKKKNSLCLALFGALGLAQAAVAQDSFDDRWYLSAGAGWVDFDDDRDVNGFSGNIGVGRFVSPNWSLDAEIWYSNPESNRDLNWSLYSLGVNSRYHFRDTGGENWWPYLMVGAGGQRHEHEISDPRGGEPIDRKDTNFMATAGAGLWADYGRAAIRVEAAARYDFDDESGRQADDFRDHVFGVTVVWKLGEYETAAPAVVDDTTPPPPPAKTCAEMDDDGDGVNNCDDKCPNSQAGQAVGPDGCPVPLTIDLRGVNFDFDKSELRPDAVQILNEALGILKKYPELKVEVAGHTDAIGTDAYNQKLSERRARAVYDYLTQNGIGADRLVGPNGYGEARPIAPNANPDGSDNPEGRAKNRRTELNVQN